MVELTNKELISELEREAEKIHNSTRVDIPLFSPVHNYLRAKSPTYYKWATTDKSQKVHLTGALAFTVSVFIFTFIQFVFPNLFLPKADQVLAGSATAVWTSDIDFNNADLADITIEGTGDSAYARISNSTFAPEGDGADGALVVSSDFNINTDSSNGRTAPDGVIWTVNSNVASGQTTISSGTAVPTGFATGDEIIIINLKGTSGDYSNVGLYEFADVQTVNANSIIVDSNLTNSYDGTTQKIVVQRVPNYTDVTINSSQTLTANAWNGTSGGALVFRSSGTVTNNGNIDVSERGYRGGSPNGKLGEWYGGGLVTSGAPCGGANGCPSLTDAYLVDPGGGGGGAGIYGYCSSSAICQGSASAGTFGSAGGGGGSGYECSSSYSMRPRAGAGGHAGYGDIGSGGYQASVGLKGGDGSGNTGGSGSLTVKDPYYYYGGSGGGGGFYGDSSLLNERVYLGSGGGSGGRAREPLGNVNGGSGGSGGGIILVGANQLVNNNNVSSDGKQGSEGTSVGYAVSGRGGSGSGGSIVIQSKNINNTGNIQADGACYSTYCAGGGRTYLKYGSKIGSVPSPNLYQTYAAPYLLASSIGGTGTGLQYGNPSEDNKYAWKTLSWDGTDIDSTYKVQVQVRPADTWGSGDTGYVNPVTGNSSWYEITSDSGSENIHSSIFENGTKTIEVRLQLVGGGASTPNLDSLTIGYDYIDTPIDLKSHRSDDDTEITTWTNGNVVSKADIRGVQNGDTLTPQFEVRTDTSFTGTPATPTGITATVNNIEYTGDGSTWMQDQNLGTISGLSPGTYYYKVRITDDSGRVSGWSDTSSAIQIEQTPPTGTLSIDIAEQGGQKYTNQATVDLNLTAKDTGGSGLNDYVNLSNDGTTWSDWSNQVTWSGSGPWTATITDFDLTTLGGDDANTEGDRTVYVQYKDNAGNVSGTWLQTSDADFNAGETKNNVVVEDNSILLGEADLTGWISGPVSGIVVKSSDSGTATWKTSASDCNTPQCGLDGGQDGDNLVDPTTNPSVDFSGYQAQQMCSSEGGRLPTKTELSAIYTNKSSYGSFQINFYWTSAEYSTSNAWRVSFGNGVVSNSSKTNAYPVRCVKDAGVYSLSGIFESEVYNFGTQIDSFGAVNFTSTTPGTTGITVEARAGNVETPDSSWTNSGNWLTITDGSDLDVMYDGNQYLQYKVSMTGDGSETPTFSDITFTSSNTDTITYDNTDPGLASGTISAPAGSESLVGGTDSTITWDNTKITDAVSGLLDSGSITLRFSSNNGVSWSDIATNEDNDGSYSWTVNNVTCVNTCKIGILAEDKAGNVSDDNAANSASNSFSITADTSGPVWDNGATLDVASSDKYTDGGGDIWTKATTTLSWSPGAADPQSGISKYQILLSPGATVQEDNISGGSTQSQTTFASEGTYTWYPNAVNGAGDEESTVSQFDPDRTHTINVDDTAPTKDTFTIEAQTNQGNQVGTKSSIVNLLIAASDTSGSGVKYMSFSNSDDGSCSGTFSSPEPYATSKAGWDLSNDTYGGTSTKGTKYVCVKFYDNVGNVNGTAFGDTIVWEDTAPANPTLDAPSNINNVASTYSDPSWTGNSSVTISWPAPTDGAPSSGLLNYTVYRSLDSANVADAQVLPSMPITNLSINDTGLIDGHIYRYWVKATDNANNSSNYLVGQSAAEVNLPDVTNPETPTGFAAVGSDDTTVQATWTTAPENSTSHSGKAHTYTVERTAALGTSEPVNENGTCTTNSYVALAESPISFENGSYYDGGTDTYTVSNTVTAEQWYYYRARSTDEGGRNSTWSCYKGKGNFAPNFTTDDIAITVNNSHTADTVAPGDIVTVTFNVSDEEGRTDLDTGNAAQRVRITDGAGSEVLAYASVVDDNLPTSDKADYVDGNGKEGYTYTYNYTLPSDSLYGTYTVYVHVADSVATGNPGENTHNKLLSKQFKTPPGMPTSVTSEGYTSTSVKLTWTAPGSAGNQSGLKALDTWKVYKSSTIDGTYNEVTTNLYWGDYTGTGTNQKTQDTVYIRSLTPESDNFFKVRAVDISNNDGTLSAASSANATEPPLPQAPDSATVKDASHTAIAQGGTYPLRYLVSWDAVTDSDVPDFKGYKVYRSTNSTWDPTPIAEIDCDTLGENRAYYLDLHTSADESNIYQYRVKTWDEADNLGAEAQTLATNVALTPQLVTQPTSTEQGVSWVKLTWKSNQSSAGLVKYREQGSGDFISFAGDPDATTTQDGSDYVHTATVRGLTKDTSYEFIVQSMNASDILSAESNTITASTKPFNIIDITKDITASGAEISWQTGSVSSEGYVEYRKGSGDTKVAGTGSDATTHSVEIDDLTPGDYVFTLKNIDTEGNITQSALQSFTITGYDTGALSTPQAGQISESDITATSAKITWTSTVATSSWVDYGTQSGKYTKSAGNDTLSIDHVVTLEGLTPGSTYYYVVRGLDANETEYKSKEASFTAQSKPSISQVKVYDIAPYTARVRIVSTKDVQASFTFGEASAFDLKAGGDTLAKEHELTLENLSDNTTYTYYVDIQDTAGNTARSEQGTFSTPLDTEPPVLSDIKLSPLTGSEDDKRGVIITWTTDKPASSQVAYSAGVIAGTYNQKSPKEEASSTAHTVVINNLDAGTTYHFQLLSEDKRGNLGESADYTMITQEQQESILELILKTLEDTFSWVGKIGEFFGNTFSQLFSMN